MRRLFLFHLFIVFFSCVDRGATLNPAWLDVRPNDDLNWYGVGSVKKDKSVDFKSVARSRALSEISEQIKVNIKSKLVDVIEANNDQINEFSSSITESRVETSLENIEYLDSFISRDGQFHVVARLNREKYFKKIASELKKAEISSGNLIQSATSELNGSSFKLLSEAMDQIDPYLDLNPKMVFSPQSAKEEAIYDVISKLIYDYNNRVNIVSEPKNIVFRPLLDSKKEFRLKVIDKKTNSPISNISLVVGGFILDIHDTLVTDSEGIIKFVLPDYFPVSSKNKVIFKLDFSKINNSQVKHLMEISTLEFPLNAEIIYPLVYVEGDFINLGEKISNKFIVDKIKTLFENSYSATFVNSLESSDLRLSINIRTEQRRERINNNFPYIVHSSGGLILTKTTDNVDIKNIQFPEKKGSDFNSARLAGIDAINKMVKELELSFTNSK